MKIVTCALAALLAVGASQTAFAQDAQPDSKTESVRKLDQQGDVVDVFGVVALDAEGQVCLRGKLNRIYAVTGGAALTLREFVGRTVRATGQILAGPFVDAAGQVRRVLRLAAIEVQRSAARQSSESPIDQHGPNDPENPIDQHGPSGVAPGDLRPEEEAEQLPARGRGVIQALEQQEAVEAPSFDWRRYVGRPLQADPVFVERIGRQVRAFARAVRERLRWISEHPEYLLAGARQ